MLDAVLLLAVVWARPSRPTARAPGDPVPGQTYPATPYLRRLTADNGWRAELIRDRHGEPAAIVAVRVGPSWPDSVAIEGEDRCVATSPHLPRLRAARRAWRVAPRWARPGTPVPDSRRAVAARAAQRHPRGGWPFDLPRPSVVDAIFYLDPTGWVWRQLPRLNRRPPGLFTTPGR